MDVDTSEKWLPLYEALASKVRLRIIEILSTESLNIRELAERLSLSSTIMTMHVRKLEQVGIINVVSMPSKGGLQKKCILNVDKELTIKFPGQHMSSPLFQSIEMPIGHFIECEIHPSCGLATVDTLIGEGFDDPRFFADPQRVNAGIVWFGYGFIEYRVPNPLSKDRLLQEVEISMEIASEAPYAHDYWPSDITFYLNGVQLGDWTSPGDFADHRGVYTPKWWPSETNQYGLLKALRVTQAGTYIDEQKISNVTLNDIPTDVFWKLRFEVKSTARHVGGLTLYGKGFGNHDQDIIFTLYYTEQ